MSQKQYLKALNAEIQKLNDVIDHKIVMHSNYKDESRRHKELIRQLQREKKSKSLIASFGFNFFSRA